MNEIRRSARFVERPLLRGRRLRRQVESMCNLYSMTAAREAIIRLFKVADNRAAAI